MSHFSLWISKSFIRLSLINVTVLLQNLGYLRSTGSLHIHPASTPIPSPHLRLPASNYSSSNSVLCSQMLSGPRNNVGAYWFLKKLLCTWLSLSAYHRPFFLDLWSSSMAKCNLRWRSRIPVGNFPSELNLFHRKGMMGDSHSFADNNSHSNKEIDVCHSEELLSPDNLTIHNQMIPQTYDRMHHQTWTDLCHGFQFSILCPSIFCQKMKG